MSPVLEVREELDLTDSTFVAPWEPLEPDRPLFPFDQLALVDNTVVSVRVTPPRSELVTGPPEERERMALDLRLITTYARAGRVTVHPRLQAGQREAGRPVTMLMLGEREARGLAVGGPRRRLLTGTSTGLFAVVRAILRLVAMILTWPVDVARSIATSKERNDAAQELANRVVAVFPDAEVELTAR